MPLSRRYTPEHPPGEACLFGYDFSFIIPPGVGIDHGEVEIWTNTVEPADASADWQIGPVEVRNQAIYCSLSGGLDGTDYQVRWKAFDTMGNTWPRTALVLCAQTS